jgi:ankyrin repeat protein
MAFPLIIACGYGKPGQLQLISRLISLGSDLETKDDFRGSALQMAAAAGNEMVACHLLDLGANVNSMGGKFGFPLQAAASFYARGKPGALELLLAAGADVNSKGGKYGSALEAAAFHDRRFVEILLNHRADVNATRGKFGSPLKAARAGCGRKKHKKWLHRVVSILLDNGARDE